MISSNRELKERARMLLPGHYGVLIISMLCADLLISIAAGLFPAAGTDRTSLMISAASTFIISLLAGVIHAGRHWQQLNLIRQRKVQFTDIFHCFRDRPDRAIVITFILALINVLLFLPAAAIVYIFIRDYAPVTVSGRDLIITVPPLRETLFVMAILLVWLIAVIAVNLHYVMAYYVFADEPGLGAVGVLRTSRRLMRGHRLRLAGLLLSFLGLILLGILSLGIGFLWIIPYINTTETCFYQEIASAYKEQI